MILTLESVDEIVQFDYSREGYSTIFSRGTV